MYNKYKRISVKHIKLVIHLSASFLSYFVYILTFVNKFVNSFLFLVLSKFITNNDLKCHKACVKI